MPVQYIFYALSHTDILHISHLSILLNLVITTSVYVTACLWRQIICGTNWFFTINHNIVFLSYSNTCL